MLESVKEIMFFNYRHLYVDDIILILDADEVLKELKKYTDKRDNWCTYKMILKSDKVYYIQLADDKAYVGLSVSKGEFYVDKFDRIAFE